MKRRKSKTIIFYGDVSAGPISSSPRSCYINIPRFKHKKKPISMFKALEVRDRINKRDNPIYSEWDNNVDYIGGLIYLDGKVLPGVSKATIKSVQDNTGLTVVDLTLYANNHKR
ncbi:hypothetical protein [Lactococcus lactis]|uniref:hypothetical protein n=1 Tax=Lactococcus lactis TaxID=1358 RepID=UPI001913BA2A|nr:hypothetical protein [Lactococcus lactis]WDA69253.1 hypothetical protein IL310_04195 [Lactococcus lactis]